MDDSERIKEIKEFLDGADARICGIIGHISAIGDDKFPLLIHNSLANILIAISELRKEFK